MDMFVSMDALDTIRFSALKSDGWYIEPVRAAMESGNILYAGKYSAPDYEQILAEGCDLAIENEGTAGEVWNPGFGGLFQL